MNPQSSREAAGPSRKRKGQNLDVGDRFCSECGYLIWAQSVKKIGTCTSKECQAHQPLMSNMYKFSNGIGRCAEIGCGVIITDRMKYCYFCGYPSEVNRKKQERDDAEKLAIERRKSVTYMEEILKLKEQVREQNETIRKLDNDLMKPRLPVVENVENVENDIELFADDDDELLASGEMAEAAAKEPKEKSPEKEADTTV